MANLFKGLKDPHHLHCVERIQMRENTDQNNSEYGQFLRSVKDYRVTTMWK